MTRRGRSREAAKRDRDHLQAEMSLAQSNGQASVLVNVSEMQSVLHHISVLERERAFLKGGKPKLAGVVEGDELRDLIEGKRGIISLRRRKTPRHSTQLYFITIEGPADDQEARTATGSLLPG